MFLITLGRSSNLFGTMSQIWPPLSNPLIRQTRVQKMPEMIPHKLTQAKVAEIQFHRKYQRIPSCVEN